MARNKIAPRSRVFLRAFGQDGKEVLRIDVSYDEYYDGTTPLIDSEKFRAEQGVLRVTGEIYDSKGHLQQSFENNYDDTGKYIGGRAVHSDGTVIEHQ